MVQRYDATPRKTEAHKNYGLLLEQEKLFSNVEALKQTSTVMFEKRDNLDKLFIEIQCSLEDTRSINMQLNHMAMRLDLPLFSRET